MTEPADLDRESIFVHVPAYIVCHLDGARARVALEHPANRSGPARTIVVDFAATPSSGRAWHEVQVDDYMNGTHRGFSSVSPHFPHSYLAGSMVLRLGYWLADPTRAQELMDAAADGGNAGASVDRSHEYTAYIQPTEKGVRRYGGFTGSHLESDLYLVRHAGASRHRARRTIRLAKTDILGEPTDVPGPMYIEQQAARSGGLVGPKRPPGASEGLLKFLSLRFARAKSASVSPPNLSVFEDLDPDDETEVGRIYRWLENTTIMRKGDLRSVLDHAGTYERLDLIGHSTAETACLRLNGVSIDARRATAMFAAAADLIAARGIREIRLLGCRTASSEAGRATVAAIKCVLPACRVLATRTDIVAGHFQREIGFNTEALLVDDVQLAKGPIGDPPPDEDPWFPRPEPSSDRPTEWSLAWFPEASHMQVAACRVRLWTPTDAQLAALVAKIDPASEASDPDPFEPAAYQIVLPDASVIRAFELVENPVRVRLSRAEGGLAYQLKAPPPRFTDAAVNELLGTPPEGHPRTATR